MVWRCVVKNCNNKGSKGVSSFKVPSDQNLRDKWIAVIPSITYLRDEDRICEQHFQETAIIREYLRRGDDGKIIAQVKFQHPRLRKGAIPTIFDNYSTQRNFQPKPEKCLTDKDDPDPLETTPLIDKKTSDVEIIISEDSNTETCQKNEVPEVEKEKNATKVDVISTDDDTEVFIYYNDTINIHDPKVKRKYVSIIKNSMEEENSTNEASDINLVEIENSPNEINLRDPFENITHEEEKKLPGITLTFDGVSFECDRQTGDDKSLETLPIFVPKPWNPCISVFGGETVLIFTYFTEVIVDEITKHIVSKAVLIKKSREIIYEVYSMPVDVSDFKFPISLTNFSRLPEILKKFKDIRLCKGITTDTNGLYAQYLTKNLLGVWHHKNCSIVSISKEKCLFCQRLNKTLIQKLSRMKKRNQISDVPTIDISDITTIEDSY